MSLLAAVMTPKREAHMGEIIVYKEWGIVLHTHRKIERVSALVFDSNDNQVLTVHKCDSVSTALTQAKKFIDRESDK